MIIPSATAGLGQPSKYLASYFATTCPLPAFRATKPSRVLWSTALRSGMYGLVAFVPEDLSTCASWIHSQQTHEPPPCREEKPAARVQSSQKTSYNFRNSRIDVPVSPSTFVPTTRHSRDCAAQIVS